MGFATAIDLLDAGKRPAYVVEHATNGLEQRLVESILRDLPNAMKRRHQKLVAPLIRRTPFGSSIDLQAAGRALFPIQPMPPGAIPVYTEDDDS